MDRELLYDEIAVNCPICEEPTTSDLVGIDSQVRVCDNCEETYFIGAIFIAHPDKDVLDLVRQTLTIAIEHPRFAECFNDHIEKKYIKDENGNLIRKAS